MTEKSKSEKMTNSSKPVPMKLFAAWEVDRTPSNCIPRLCTLTVTRLRVTGAAVSGAAGAGGADSGAISLAARMHSSKRTLRSNDIPLPAADVELDLNFSLQYPHFVKRDGNRLQIMLQRRKKYKNRTILGYKTLAEGVIRMDQVLQRSTDMDLELYGVGGGKGGGGVAGGTPFARLTIAGLASLPVDHDSKNNNSMAINDRVYSDEEEEAEFSSVEENDEALPYPAPERRRIAFNKDLSYTKLDRYMNVETDRDRYIGVKGCERDSDSELEAREARAGKRKDSHGKLAQRNLKQKFAALLRRFRVPDELAERGPGGRVAALDDGDREIDELFQELESLSCGEGDDSGPDTISIGSTPKPSLRPFFSSSRSLANAGGPHTNDVANSYNSNARRRAAVGRGGVGGGVPQARVTVTPQRMAHTDSSAQTTKERRHTTNITTTDSDSQWMSGVEPIDRPELGSTVNSDGEPECRIDPGNVSSSPPKDKDEKRSRLFRAATSGGLGVSSSSTPSAALVRKKQSLSITGSNDLRISTSGADTAASPTSTEPRRCAAMMEQLSRLLPADEGAAPECLALSAGGPSAATLAAALAAVGVACAMPTHAADVRQVMQALLNRINKQSARWSRVVRVIVVGGDTLTAWVLRAFADLWARRPPDSAPALKFYIIPVGANCLSRQLSVLDPGYAALFGSESWASLFERSGETSIQDMAEMTSRVLRYFNGASTTVQLPIAEAMVVYREKSCDENSTQIFVPFVTDVRLGSHECSHISSMDLEEGGSPPARPSPPATPAPLVLLPPAPLSTTDGAMLGVPSITNFTRTSEPLELLVDYWQMSRISDGCPRVDSSVGGRGRAGAPPSSEAPPSTMPLPAPSKTTLKCTFRGLQVARASSSHDALFNITYTTKEKKQKIMRLGKKKEKERESESGRTHGVEAVCRLICSTKASHHAPIRVYIDGTEWNSVKFFQLSTQWPTHVKHFPVALTGAPLAPQET